ncbi:lipase [Streptomyces sp. ERV7]|uniref:esterase/lipase family protein n=1 Tax=Streptomyces sp. ERV7 TaxID=1322334 RepID=UPI0007F45B01|nr:triacylglycerol lipase [Streptomyces sp. ERV7]OAR23677.1 lipase [Streptomyces sp. ERV7]OAR23684.1 lipase [Streptomyces sp. ERV7]
MRAALSRISRACATVALAVTGLAAASAAPAGASEAGTAATLPVETHFSSGFLAGFLKPGEAPPGANDFSCRSTAHPNPVVLVHGTMESMNDNWRGAAPLLANEGYCVFAFTYGGTTPTSPIQGTGKLEEGAAGLASFVERVRTATGAPKVDLVAHSQGGLTSRYYLKNLGGTGRVDRLVALSTPHHGTTLDGLTELSRTLHILEPMNEFVVGPACPACLEQEVGSDFLKALNAGGETVPGVTYTNIATKFDEVTTPYTSAFLAAGPHVTNITVQDQCVLDGTDHTEISYDPIALTHVLNALDPAHPRAIPCQVVLPVTGPLL